MSFLKTLSVLPTSSASPPAVFFFFKHNPGSIAEYFSDSQGGIGHGLQVKKHGATLTVANNLLSLPQLIMGDPSPPSLLGGVSVVSKTSRVNQLSRAISLFTLPCLSLFSNATSGSLWYYIDFFQANVYLKSTNTHYAFFQVCVYISF